MYDTYIFNLKDPKNLVLQSRFEATKSSDDQKERKSKNQFLDNE